MAAATIPQQGPQTYPYGIERGRRALVVPGRQHLAQEYFRDRECTTGAERSTPRHIHQRRLIVRERQPELVGRLDALSDRSKAEASDQTSPRTYADRVLAHHGLARSMTAATIRSSSSSTPRLGQVRRSGHPYHVKGKV